MKKIILALSLVIFGSAALAEVISLKQIIKNAPASETKNLTKLLKDISFRPAKNAQGKKVYKVTKVAAGSIYEKAGVKIGDLVSPN